MFKKVINLMIIFTCAFVLISCEENHEEQEENKSEYIVMDENLKVTETIEDNYRVFYEIFTGSFSDSNGDGVGDLQGIINRLDYLNDGDPNSGKSLGIEGIWLTPIFTSPSYHKYDVSNYYEIDPEFGNMDDLKELVQECHKRGIKIILDLVINHSGNKNPWFLNFVAAHKKNDTSDPYYNFYSHYLEGETAPNNGKYYKAVGTVGTYYEANFDSSMPELNYDNEEVRQAVLDVAKYYLDLGVDGFRFDAAKYVYYGDEERSSQFWNWYIAELKKIKPDIYTVGEVWSADSIINKYIENGLNCFNFSTSQLNGYISEAAKSGNISGYTKYIETYLKTVKDLNTDAMLMQFISNHDMDRASGYLTISSGQIQMAANIYLLSSGSPFIYYGEEIGIKGSRGSASTDANRRVAMLWGDDDKISDPVGTTYSKKLQTNGTVAEHIVDQNSLYNHYKKVIMIRKANPEIARGTYTSINTKKSSLGGFVVTYNGSSVCILHNVSTDVQEIDLSSLGLESYTSLNAFVGLGDARLEGTKLIISGQTSVVLR